MAWKSKNLKSTFVKKLKDAVEAMRNIVGALTGRSTDMEVCQLRTANQRLQGEVVDLRKRLEELEGRLNSRTSAQPAAKSQTPVLLTRNGGRNASASRGEEEMELETDYPPPPPPLQGNHLQTG